MARYLVFRIGSLLVSLVASTMVVFFIMHAIPGGPFNAEKSTNLTPAQVANINRLYGLDKPLPVQYWNFLWNALHLNFGESYQDPGEPITALLGRVWPISAFAGGMGILIGVGLGMLIGVAAALWRNSWIDYVATVISIATITLPAFVVSIGLLLIFAVALRWFPASGWNGPSTWVLPILAYATIPLGP
jgi:ABC-type dipeptide/oligopeptide/nickel transport system permease component